MNHESKAFTSHDTTVAEYIECDKIKGFHGWFKLFNLYFTLVTITQKLIIKIILSILRLSLVTVLRIFRF
jgi:hypothetical protein